MSNFKPFDSFKNQAEFEDYVTHREASAVSGGLRGLAQGISEGSDSNDPEQIVKVILGIAEVIEANYGVEPG